MVKKIDVDIVFLNPVLKNISLICYKFFTSIQSNVFFIILKTRIKNDTIYDCYGRQISVAKGTTVTMAPAYFYQYLCNL